MFICVVSLYGQKCDKVQMIHQTETYFTTISLIVPKFVYCHLSPLFYLSNNMQCNAQNLSLSLAFFHIAFSTVLELDQWLLICCNDSKMNWSKYDVIIFFKYQHNVYWDLVVLLANAKYIEKITLHCLLISYKFCTHS